MIIPKRTAIIGRIPGYNRNIDANGEFSKELLKGLTVIDLRPMTYTFGDELKTQSVSSFFADVSKMLNANGLFRQDDTISKKIFHEILQRMGTGFNLSNKQFAEVDMIRILAANDSTFTETFSNSYGEENGIAAIADAVTNKAGKAAAAVKVLQKGLKSYSHAEMISLAGNMAAGINGETGQAAIEDIMADAAFGMDMAVPTMWNGSSYTSNLTIFIKLVAPVGTQECIQKNILEPILYLLAAASPLTYNGIMYGFPLLWDIQGQGITNFRIGGIQSMSLIRGSFETTFNHLLQPTVIDVRLTLVPLLNDFAVQTNSSMAKSIYAPENRKYLGVQNPADINQGLMNVHNYGPAIGANDEVKTIKL